MIEPGDNPTTLSDEEYELLLSQLGGREGTAALTKIMMHTIQVGDEEDLDE